MQKVLIIEDDKLVQEKIKIFLEDKGYEVLQAFDGKEGLNMINSKSPDVVVLDLALPEKDGYHLLQDLDIEATPVIVVSSLVSEASKVECMGAGVFAYIEKVGDFLPELAKALEALKD